MVMALTLTAAASNARAEAPREVTFRTQTMGTWASLTLVTADSASVESLAYDALVTLHFVDSLMSNWTETSEVARINRVASQRTTQVHAQVVDVLTFALEVSWQSDGAFDITVEPLVRLWGFLGGTPRVPSQDEIDAVLFDIGTDKLSYDDDQGTMRFLNDRVSIDLGGIAKGYGVDRVAALLRASGISNALVDLSGNMVALGNAATHEGWTVGVRDPSGELPYLVRITLHNQAVATSADYEQFVDANGQRYGHILDPRSGWSARGLSSVTVVSELAMAADAWATALFVLGPDAARDFVGNREDLAAVLIEPRDDGTTIIWVERSLQPRCVAHPDLGDTYRVRFF